jgi:LAO/AO transport system kinase
MPNHGDIPNLIARTASRGPASVRAAARLMSIVTDHPERVATMLAGATRWPQPRLVLGITGAPGSGKSTLVDQIASSFRSRYPEQLLGILAVDPSSPFTGGAVLGDRVRMMRHATDPKVFIRSLASRGHLGGLALGARGVTRIMGLLGCEIVIIETVGVGQSEVEVAQNADLTAVVLAPGQGDSVQMLKAGLMEAGDLFVVNKADRPDAATLQANLLNMLKLGWMARVDLYHEELTCRGPQLLVAGKSPVSDRSIDAGKALSSIPDLPLDAAAPPPVFPTSATNAQGIEPLIDYVESRAARDADAWRARREAQITREVRDAVLESARNRIAHLIGRNGTMQSTLSPVLEGRISVDDLTDQLLRRAIADVQSRCAPSESKSSERSQHV